MITDKQELQRLCDPTDEELIQFAVDEQFLLFCDEEEFVQIAREVLHKWGRKHAAELAAVTAERDWMAGTDSRGRVSGRLESVPAIQNGLRQLSRQWCR